MEKTLTKKRTTRRANVNGQRNVLTVLGKEPGFQYRIVNDTGDRISQFKEMGYELVQDNNIQVGDRRIMSPTKEGSPVKVSVGNDTQAYVMRIKDEWYEEDKVAKAEHIKETERGMLREAKQKSDFGDIRLS